MSAENQPAPPELDDHERLARARTEVRRQMIAVSVMTLVIMTLAVGAGFAVAGSQPQEQPVNPWLVVVLPFVLMALMLAVTGWVVWRRWLRLGSDFVTLAAEPARSRRVSTELRKGRDIPVEDRTFARLQVKAMRKQRWLTWFMPVVGIAWFVQAVVFDRDIALRWLSAVVGAFWLLSSLWARRVRRRILANAARRELDAATGDARGPNSTEP